jgi:ABC-type branched-subunit amino acid transport system substrate-binding protein
MFCNSVLLAAAPIFNRAGVPVLTCGANPGDQKGLGAKIFRIFPADHLGVYPLTHFIAQRHKRLCMVTESEAYPELVARTVQSEWRKLGSDYELFSETVNFGEKDFRSVLLKLNQKNCGALFINPVADDGFIAAFKQTRALQISGTIYSYYMPGSPAVQKALGGSLNGVIYATLPSSDELATSLGKKFNKLYQDQFGEHQVAVPVALFAFEAFRLIVEARKAALPLDEFVRNRTIGDGAIQKYSFDEDGASHGIEFKMVEFRDGREQFVAP